MGAVKERPISDDAETSRIEAPISGFQPSKAAEKPRDTVNDPPRRPLILSVFLFVLDILLFLPRIAARAILYEMRAFAAHFKTEPTLSELLPNPAPRLARRNLDLTPDEVTELVTQELFRVPSHYLAGVIRIASVLRDIPLEDKDDRFDVFVLLCLSRLRTDRGKAVPIAWLRAKLPEVERRVLNSSLERLEQYNWITLLDPSTDDPLFVRDGLTIVSRGRFTHVRPLRRF
jgi:hypothetical protein